jgi:hypothetical protein
MQKPKSGNPTYEEPRQAYTLLGGWSRYIATSLILLMVLHFAAATLPLHRRYMINMTAEQIHNMFCDKMLFID